MISCNVTGNQKTCMYVLWHYHLVSTIDKFEKREQNCGSKAYEAYYDYYAHILRFLG